MATFIRVSSAEAELLRRNRDQVQANRLQKVEADEQAATGQQLQATADEQQTLEQPGGRRQSRFRRDQPAASLIPSDFRTLLLLQDSFVDQSRYKCPVLPVGATLDAANSKIGATAFYIARPSSNTGNDRIAATINSSTKNPRYPLPIGSQDFTVDFWIRFAPDVTTFNFQPITTFPDVVTIDDDVEGSSLGVGSLDGSVYLTFSQPGTGSYFSAVPLPVYEWSHVAFMRKDGVAYAFVNGQNASPSGEPWTSSIEPGDFWFGPRKLASSDLASNTPYPFKGWFDEICIRHGAVYPLSGFAPSLVPYPIP